MRYGFEMKIKKKKRTKNDAGLCYKHSRVEFVLSIPLFFIFQITTFEHIALLIVSWSKIEWNAL